MWSQYISSYLTTVILFHSKAFLFLTSLPDMPQSFLDPFHHLFFLGLLRCELFDVPEFFWGALFITTFSFQALAAVHVDITVFLSDPTRTQQHDFFPGCLWLSAAAALMCHGISFRRVSVFIMQNEESVTFARVMYDFKNCAFILDWGGNITEPLP